MKKILVVILTLMVSAAAFAVDNDSANRRLTLVQQRNSYYHDLLASDAALLLTNTSHAQYLDLVRRISVLQGQISLAQDAFVKNPTQAGLDEVTRLVTEHDRILQELNQFVQNLR
jgi:hypothetical protein